MTDDPGRSIADNLATAAGRFPVPSGDADAVMGRANARRRRQRITGVAAVTLLLASSVGILVVRAGAGGDGETPLASGAAATRGSLGLGWQRVEPDAARALGPSHSVTDGAPIYALSTAAGERFGDGNQTLSRVLWRSDDGVEWSAVTTFGDDLYLGDLATSTSAKGRVYAVGTQPATAAVTGKQVSELVAGWSDDGAKKWNKQRLPLDWDALRTNAITSTPSASIATGRHGTVIVTRLVTRLDVPALLPADAPSSYEGWATTQDGIVLLGALRSGVCPAREGEPAGKGPEAHYEPGRNERGPVFCAPHETRDARVSPTLVNPEDAYEVLATYSFADLGVEGDLLAAARRDTIAFHAPAGSTDFERVDLPPLRGTVPVSIVAGDDGFDLVGIDDQGRFGERPGTLATLHSADGRSWSRSGTPSTAGSWVVGAGHLGSSPAFVSSRNEGDSSVNIASDGSATTWRSIPLSSIVPAGWPGPDRTFNATTASFGPFGIAVHVIAFPDSEKVEPEEEPTFDELLLLSRDGHTWDAVSIDDLVGQDGYALSRTSIVGDDVVVTVAPRMRQGAPTDPPRQLVFVGRPS